MSFIRHGQPVITRLFPHAGNRRYIKAKSGEGSPPTPPGPTPDFHALVPDPATGLMTGVLTGTGGLTTTHAQPIYAKDEKGVYQRFPANAPVWEGARCVLAGGPGTDVVEAYGTDSGSQPLPEAPWLVYQPALTNSVVQSYDATNWPLEATSAPATVALDQVGMDGAPNKASMLTDTGGGTQNKGDTLNGLSAAEATFVFRVLKRTQPATGFAALAALFNTSWEVIHFNQETGAFNQQTTGGATVEVVDEGSWWTVYCHRTIAITSLTYYVYPALATVFGGGNDASATGDIIIGNVEIYLDKTIAEVRGSGPIFTAGAAGSTDSPAYTFDNANCPLDSAAWYLEHSDETPAAGTGGAPNPTNIFRRGAATWADLMRLQWPRMLTARTWTGSEQTASGPNINGEGIPDKLANVYHQPDNLWALNANGVYGADAAFNGLGDNGTELFLTDNSFHKVRCRNLRQYSITSFADGKSIIDTLMGS